MAKSIIALFLLLFLLAGNPAFAQAPKTPFAAIIDEVFLNFGDRITYNTFDHNRFFAGFGYQFTTHLNAQLGYMNIYQQEASGNNYFSTHAIRLFLFHSLDLRNEPSH